MVNAGVRSADARLSPADSPAKVNNSVLNRFAGERKRALEMPREERA